MRALLVASILLSSAGASHALTCTAPGHSSCTITCPGGCGALYVEPNGPCRTFCSSSATTSGAASMSTSGVSMEELIETLSDPSKMQESK